MRSYAGVRTKMVVCLNKLWKILIDRGMSKNSSSQLKLVQMPWQNWKKMKMSE